jgi:hypothetical protein
VFKGFANNSKSTYKDFYPTPQALIDRMLDGLDWRFIESILEPSAGKGDLADGVVEKAKQHTQFGRYKPDIECIEVNPDLQNVLKGKGYRVVHDDFLTYITFRRYDLIVMNPPFSEGDKHLLKALELQKKGGSIVCLLNAETLRNPYSNTRKELLQKLDKYDTDIEIVEGAFKGSDVERKTNVDIAIVRVYIPQSAGNSVILSHLEKAKDNVYIDEQDGQGQANIAPNDIIAAVVAQYQYEARAGCQLIQDFRAMQPVTSKEFDSDNSILKLIINEYNGDIATETAYIKELRYKYWKTLFQSEKFSGIFTSNLRSAYMEKLDELKNYEFSFYNIYQLRIDMSKQMVQGIEGAILELFEELSYKYSYYDETSRNIHYYNGWKTNKAYTINKRVIIPLSAYDSWDSSFNPGHRVESKLRDIEKVFDYLSGDISDEDDVRATLEYARKRGKTKKIPFKYFEVNFYKKGTCHITFTNHELLKKFNLFGSQSKNWLPPNYGKVRYKDMTDEEKAVVDSFEGEKAYEETFNNKDFYLCKPSVLMLT